MQELTTKAKAKRRKIHFDLPLLRRELIEAANRGRTYALRVVYALILFMLVGSMGVTMFRAYNNDPLVMLGQGKELFTAVVVTQFIAIYLLVPAMACSAITAEKEKNTIDLLLISKLGPWTIIFEKLIARIIPVCMCLLVSVPLMGVLFSIGGMTSSMISTATFMLFVTVLQVASLSVFCSTYFRKTSSAFLWTLALGFIWILGLPTVAAMVNATPSGAFRDFIFMFLTPYLFFTKAYSSGVYAAFLASRPILIGCAILICLSRYLLIPRALSKSTPITTRLARMGRDVTQDIKSDISGTRRQTTGSRLAQSLSRTDYPLNHPVAWRQSRLLLGNQPFVAGFGCLFFAMAAFMCMVAAVASSTNTQYFMTGVMWVFLLAFSCLVAAVRMSALISTERDRQTLDILLTTPLQLREIILDKMKVAHRFGYALLLPMILFSLYLMAWRSSAQHYRSDSFDPTHYFVCTLLMAIVYPRLTAWIAFAVSLRTKQHASAMLFSILLVIGWCALPLILFMAYYMVTWQDATDLPFPTVHFSPFFMVGMNEDGYWDRWEVGREAALFWHFALQIGFLLLLRWWCLTRAARILGRGETPNSKRSFTTQVAPINLPNR